MLLQIFNTISPIFAITILGFLIGRSDLKVDAKSVGSVVVLVSTPSLVFSKLTTIDIPMETLVQISTAAVLCIMLPLLFGLVVLRALKMSYRTFLPAVTMPNCGNVGLPLMILAFGQTGSALGISFFFVVALAQFTIGAAISAGGYSPRDLLKQPLIYAIICVLIVLTTGVAVPEPIAKTTDILGGMMIPAMLLLLGSSLATLSVSDIRPAIVIALCRLFFGISSGLIVITLLSLEGVVAGTVFLMSSMPATVISYVFAEKYRPNPQQVAGGIVLSTLLVFLLLPLLLWIALNVFAA